MLVAIKKYVQYGRGTKRSPESCKYIKPSPGSRQKACVIVTVYPAGLPLVVIILQLYLFATTLKAPPLKGEVHFRTKDKLKVAYSFTVYCRLVSLFIILKEVPAKEKVSTKNK